MDIRKCNRCEIDREITEYYKIGNGSSQFKTICKDCIKKRYIETRETAPKQKYDKERCKEYYIKKRDSKLNYQKQYNESNKEKIKAYQKLYYKMNRLRLINQKKEQKED